MFYVPPFLGGSMFTDSRERRLYGLGNFLLSYELEVLQWKKPIKTYHKSVYVSAAGRHRDPGGHSYP